MNKEIEELADDIYWEESKFEIVTKSGCEDFAKMLYDLGYRKQVWHKVADGDLPIKLKEGLIAALVQIYYKDEYGHKTTYPAHYYFSTHRFRLLEGDSFIDVIAWTELPKYKE